MNPAEAYRAFRDLRARWLLPCHWGTFKLTDEPIDEPPRELRRAITAANASLDPVRFLAIGERWEIPQKSPE
jgi:L-ascorbate metabolism protein UlaG (beta-lactamase superfamily)